MTKINVRPMTANDTQRCASIHVHAFQGFFLTFLGLRFLNELYTAIVHDPSCIAFVAEEDDEVVGFASGTSAASGLYKRLIRQRIWRFGWAALGAFLRKPTILPRLLRALTLPSQKTTVPNCGTLMSIAVLPELQRRGIGRLLVRSFLDGARQRRLEYINLTTDSLDNDGVNRFYERLGFRLARNYTTPEGREMNEYITALYVPFSSAASRESPPFVLSENWHARTS